MKKLLPSLCLTLLLGMSSASFSQSTLWVGEYAWSGGAANLFGYDTTGGTYTLTSTLALTSDAIATVDGVYGLALDPNTGDMYTLYHDPGAGSASRRLGIVDLTTGDITDIGVIGSMRDIEFVGSTLYAVGGRTTDGTSELWEVNTADATTTLVGNFTNPWSGVCVANNYYADELWYANFSGPDLGTVDTDPFAENTLYPSYGGFARAMTMKNDSTMLCADGSGIAEVNINTGVYTFASFFHTGTIHAMHFDQYPLSALVDGPSTFCSNEPSTLYVNESGTSYQWHVDGTLIPGAEDSTYIPTISGTYWCVLNGTDTTFDTQVLVIPAPNASFTSDPEPVQLGLDPSGVVDFTNTSIPNGHEFWWDFAGFNSTMENPSFPFPTAGSYDVTFIVYDTITGCSDTAMNTVNVINDVGIGENNGEVSIYPIPTEDIVTVSLLQGNGDHTISLMDLQGKIITEQTLVGANSKTTFDLSDFESGVYLIKVSDMEYEGYYKVVKK